MRFDHEGMSLWFEPDAPATGATVTVSGRVTITVGVQPADASNIVRVHYRVNHGPTETLATRWIPRAGKAQYFRAQLPAFHAGDTVEYTAVCMCVRRQVPSPEEAQQFAASFQVVELEAGPMAEPAAGSTKPGEAASLGGAAAREAGIPPMPRSPYPPAASTTLPPPPASAAPTVPADVLGRGHLNPALGDGSVFDHLQAGGSNKAAMNEALNATLRSKLSSTLAEDGHPTVAGLVQTMDAVDIAANKDVSVQSLVASQAERALKDDPGMKPAVDAAVAKLSDTTTVGDLLGLDQPLEEHPLFQPIVRNEAQKVALNSLLSTAPGLASSQLQDTFLSLYAKHEGPIEAFWSELRQNPDFGTKTVDELQLTLQLGALTQNHVPLIQELQSTHHVTSTRDLVKLDTTAWTDLVSKQTVGVPPDVPGATPQEKTVNYVNGIVSTLQAAFPTDVVAQIVAKAPGINLDASARKTVSQFFANAPDFDLRTSHVDNYIAANAKTVFEGIEEIDRLQVAHYVKWTQRLFQVSTSPETMTALLSTNFDSAHAIAQIPRSSFLAMHTQTFGGEQQAAMVYERAVAGNARALHVYTQLYQSAFDVQPAVIGSADEAHETIKKIPSYTELFGSLDLCDCEHCRSVYSPAAYFVDLLEFLKNSTPNSAGLTPLDVLVGTNQWMPGRRPDLPHIKLTCENTNTTIPYVDLVNEVLESYVQYHQSLPFLGGVPTTPLPPGVSPMRYTPTPNDSSDNVTGEELSANPENTNEAAYEKLRTAIYPLTLPYNQPLEVARVYLEHLGSNRADLMLAFFKDNGALAPIRAIAAESLKISAEEFEVLTGKDFSGADSSIIKFLREAYGYDSDDIARKVNNQDVTKQWRDWLADVPEFLQRTGVSYMDLIELLKTQFINAAPQSLKAITLFAQDSTCNLSITKLQHLDGGPLDDAELSKMHRFIRLWRKLGWSMHDLDRTIIALQATNIDINFLLNLAHVKRLHADLNLPVVQLVSFWAPIDVQGDDSLYKKLFLSKAALKIDDVFKPQLDGSVLSDATQTLSKHVPALVAALRISEAELTSIGIDASLPADTAPLNLANVSILYRYAVLARALKLRVNELISLKMLSGIDPFSAPDKTSQFVDIARKVRQSGFNIAQLNYLYRHLAEPSSNLLPQRESLILLAKSLRDRLTKIGEDNELVNDPTGELSRNKLGMIFESTIVDQTIRMIDGSTAYTTTLKGLPDNFLFPNELKGKVTYDKKNELLSFKGPMTPDSHALLHTASGILTSAVQQHYKDAVDALFLQPRTFIKNTLSGFLDVTVAAKNLLDTVSLDKDGKPVLLDKDGKQVVNEKTQTPVTTVITAKFSYFLDKFLPYLRDKLNHTLIKQTIGDALKLDGAMSELLLEKLKTKSTMADCLALSTPGLSATYFTDPRLAGPTSPRIDKTIAFDGKGSTPETSIPTGIGSARWTGMLLAPNNGDFTFYINTSGSVQLWAGDDQQPIQLLPPDPHTNERASAPITLKAGQLYSLRLEVRQLTIPLSATSAVVEFRWSNPTTPKDIIPSTNLYPSSVFDTFVTAFTLLQKSALLVNGFKMVDKEVAHISDHAADFDNFDLHSLPLDRSDPVQTDQKAVALFTQWQRLSAFVSLRNSMLQSDVSLINVFEAASLESKLPLLQPGSTGAAVIALQRVLNAIGTQPVLDLDGVFDPRVRTTVIGFQQSHGLNGNGSVEPPTWEALKAAIPLNLWQVIMAEAAKENKLVHAFGWDAKTLHALVTALSLTVDNFKDEIWLVRLQACMNAVKRLGVSAKQVFEWATTAWDPKQAQAIKNTVKAKYDDETWLTVAKPLNDTLRESQKAALIAYLLPRLGMNDSNQLFEYFLIDVDMSACMATSRIKQAISSVQLFVQRCLMNLEQRQDAQGRDTEQSVSPSAIDADQWQWVKHYRIWEANRKVFLYPENWIEPELRDDKSPFFKELESELLQNDLTKDTAETALLNYLEKLDQVARMEICGMYWQDKDPETFEDVNILHVFGRTFHIPHIYYYRRLINNTTWTPWEKVQADIEGDHLIPVVWNRRLYLFWPVFVEKALQNSSENDSGRRYWEIKLAWSEFKQKSWKPKQLSKEFLVSPHFPNSKHELMPKAHYSFKAQTSDNQLVIQTYLHERLNDQGTTRYDGVSLFGEFKNLGCDDKFNINYNNRWYSRFELSTIITYADTGVVPTNTITNGASAFIISPPRCLVSFMDYLEGGDFHNDIVDLAGNLTLLTGDFGDIPALDDHIVARSLDVITVLQATPTRFGLLLPHQFYQFVLQSPFFYQDAQRTYFVTPREAYDFIEQVSQFDKVRLIPDRLLQQEITRLPNMGDPIPSLAATQPLAVPHFASPKTAAIRPSSTDWATRKSDSFRYWPPPPAPTGRKRTVHLKFETYFHPYTCEFVKGLNRQGIPGLLTLSNQLLTDQQPGDFGWDTNFNVYYRPTGNVTNSNDVVEIVDFGATQAYSLYNWDLFFHVPLLIAMRLSKNQRFEDAMKWFHYIFDPTDDTKDESSPERFWKVVPFKTTPQQRIEELLIELNAAKGDADNALNKQVAEWKQHPFLPHLIARSRPIAYQKNVVMKYIDNLIAWGDQLFRQDTIEAINEATQLYVLAANILGKRPERIPPRGKVEPETYAMLKDKLDKFGNALVILENEFPSSTGVSSADGTSESGGLLGLGKTLYFCTPQNDKLLGYWDTVADRLFKIRHCMNIEGVVRQLSLFEPPIDPALLVQAVALGVDLGSVLNDLNSPTPYFRFSYMLQKALELCADLKSMGGALLSALEKKDAEELSTMRASHETIILNLIKEVKKKQLTEAQTIREGLEKTQAVTQRRFEYYRDINQRIPNEKEHLDQLQYANDRQGDAAEVEIAAQGMHLAIPDFSAGVSFSAPTYAPSPSIGVSFGGSNLGAALYAWARHINSLGSDHTYQGTKASIVGGYDRRSDEWGLQKDVAQKELDQIQKQIDAAIIREQIAQNEIDNHDKQIENAAQIEEFLRDKYTNQDLYVWMMSEISTIYFQCYQMAYDLAKKAEKAFRFERGLTTSNFIQFGYWDSLKKGLLSGERLYLALKQMERAYLEQNKREYEITKHVSLMLNDPMALITLKETGQCEVFLPEALFDADYPGHYMRRIKSVSLTIPCVVGPYTSINCTLTLLSNKTRIKSEVVGGKYEEDLENEDPRFVANFAAMQSIATSSAQNDSGMFELNFRDERYLPFEGAGVVSRWRIDLPQDCNAFDFNTLSDVILHLKYTAREGGEILKTAAKVAMQPATVDGDKAPLARLFSAKHEFPTEWYRFLHPADTAESQTLQLDLTPERFPFQFRGKSIEISQVELFLKLKDGVPSGSGDLLTMSVTPPGGTQVSKSLESNTSFLNGIPHAVMDVACDAKCFGTWVLAAQLIATLGKPDAIEDLIIVCHYSLTR
jgi:hypothetical protein